MKPDKQIMMERLNTRLKRSNRIIEGLAREACELYPQTRGLLAEYVNLKWADNEGVNKRFAVASVEAADLLRAELISEYESELYQK